MPLIEIETKPTNWDEVFKVAGDCINKSQLTAVAFVSEKEYKLGSYVATVLEEFAQTAGSVEGVLKSLRQMAPTLYPKAKHFRLLHGEMKIAHPMHTGPAWMFVIVYNN